jgi:ParB-like chromosome segregation protein Spo0J
MEVEAVEIAAACNRTNDAGGPHVPLHLHDPHPELSSPACGFVFVLEAVVDWTMHSYAGLFPLMDDAELQELADDIKEHGLRDPVVRDHHGRIIDGRNRLIACERAGVEPTCEDKQFDTDAEVLAYVISVNLQRRHLTESQRGMLAAKIATIKHGGDRRSSDFQDANVHFETPLDQAADLVNVSRRTAAHGRKVVAKGTARLQEAVEAGTIPISTAAEVAELPEHEQEQVVSDPTPRERARVAARTAREAKKAKRSLAKEESNSPDMKERLELRTAIHAQMDELWDAMIGDPNIGPDEIKGLFHHILDSWIEDLIIEDRDLIRIHATLKLCRWHVNPPPSE